ncbi:DUF2750 domain-containing protein [Agaribacter marinus]|uniref:DUF2750 domain-containing protein n=1 Tax=Agaribacter marinus TaxID=1431249 RepID=A0AA37SV68_9ALTE|nr:DUF2750 domain-containing protein [Agaribacter marinus]GLR69344.1 hypothetical protein GCM10007852_02520 [Agaribacter marinus]
MTTDSSQIKNQPQEKRYHYLLKHVVANQDIWILTDEHGCVMLNTEDEDCVPVWPSKEFADDWATGDWAHCKPQAIPLSIWHERWTDGLADDDVSIAVFPNPDEDGLVISPDEFDYELTHVRQK